MRSRNLHILCEPETASSMKPAAEGSIDVPASHLGKAGEAFLAQIHDNYWNADKLITARPTSRDLSWLTPASTLY